MYNTAIIIIIIFYLGLHKQLKEVMQTKHKHLKNSRFQEGLPVGHHNEAHCLGSI